MFAPLNCCIPVMASTDAGTGTRHVSLYAPVRSLIVPSHHCAASPGSGVGTGDPDLCGLTGPWADNRRGDQQTRVRLRLRSAGEPDRLSQPTRRSPVYAVAATPAG